MNNSAPREDILKRILARKAEEITAAVELKSLAQQSQAAEAAPAPRGFVDALNAKVNAGQAGVIAEIKTRPVSPRVTRQVARRPYRYSLTSIFSRAKVNTSRKCAPLVRYLLFEKISLSTRTKCMKPALWVRTAFC